MWANIWCFLETYSDAITALATVVMAIFTVLLFRLSRITESSNRIVERAYVFPKVNRKENFVISPTGNAPTKIEVIFTNSGKTPAVIRVLRAYSLILNIRPFELIAHERAENEISAGLAISMEAPFIEKVNVNISQAEWGEMERLEKTLYILGKIEYEDVFGIRRVTGFCWQYVWGNGSEGFIISPIPELNYYT